MSLTLALTGLARFPPAESITLGWLSQDMLGPLATEYTALSTIEYTANSRPAEVFPSASRVGLARLFVFSTWLWVRRKLQGGGMRARYQRAYLADILGNGP